MLQGLNPDFCHGSLASYQLGHSSYWTEPDCILRATGKCPPLAPFCSHIVSNDCQHQEESGPNAIACNCQKTPAAAMQRKRVWLGWNSQFPGKALDFSPSKMCPTTSTRDSFFTCKSLAYIIYRTILWSTVRYQIFIIIVAYQIAANITLSHN